ncbi:hypothetical protein Avbf_07557 [Armadillidium vulgare]|nr:hypothetical protein Avbf_17021 [Armadillidium vulgare]RXG60527.1 hypothetical protein Avbf_07557 [Armadillidium vulgare]
MIRLFRVIQLNLVSKPQRHQVYFYCQSQKSSTAVQDIDVEFKESANVNLNGKLGFEPFKNIDGISSLLKAATSNRRIDHVFKAISLLANWSLAKKIDFKEVEEDPNYGE